MEREFGWWANDRPPGPVQEYPMALIQCKKLTRSYKKGTTTITPLDGLDMDVEEGAFIALMGPSGSGKTTLLNLLAGIDSPTSGSLSVDGVDIAKLPNSKLAHWRAENIGYIFQLYNFDILDSGRREVSTIEILLC